MQTAAPPRAAHHGASSGHSRPVYVTQCQWLRTSHWQLLKGRALDCTPTCSAFCSAGTFNTDIWLMRGMAAVTSRLRLAAAWAFKLLCLLGSLAAQCPLLDHGSLLSARQPLTTSTRKLQGGKMASKTPRSPAAGSRAAATMYVTQQQDSSSLYAVRDCWVPECAGAAPETVWMPCQGTAWAHRRLAGGCIHCSASPAAWHRSHSAGHI